MSGTEAPPLGRRERKKAESRQALQDAAILLAADAGYENVTVEAIADAADVSTRTFFNYFSSKDEALLAPNPDTGEMLVHAIAERPSEEPPLVAMRAVLAGVTERLSNREEFWQARMRLVAQNPQLMPRLMSNFGSFEQAMTTALAVRTGRDERSDPYPALVAATITATLRVALLHWQTSGAASLPAFVDDLLSQVAAGLPQPPETST